jgi:hypothetical protein
MHGIVPRFFGIPHPSYPTDFEAEYIRPEQEARHERGPFERQFRVRGTNRCVRSSQWRLSRYLSPSVRPRLASESNDR